MLVCLFLIMPEYRTRGERILFANEQMDLSPPPSDARKSRWRAWARAVRAVEAAVPPHVRDEAIAAHICAWDVFARARHVLLFLPAPSEVDLAPLARDPGRSLYVTRTWPDPQRALTVHVLDPAGLETHRWGFRQPRADAADVDPALVELALVPGLAFDATGTRLGSGGGYFDRLLATLGERAVKVGVTPAAALVPRLPREPHDVPMDYLVTEDGVRAVAP